MKPDCKTIQARLTVLTTCDDIWRKWSDRISDSSLARLPVKLRLCLFLRVLAAFAMTFAVAGCGSDASYRYKLTLAVNTPGGVKRGSSVVEVAFWNVSIPAKGTAFKLRGEALYLDLGPGERPLIALLTKQLHQQDDKNIQWTRNAGAGVRQMFRLYNIHPSADYMDDIPGLARMRGLRQIAPGNLPDLVTFADVKDPSSVIEVDPGNLQQTLGSGVSWNEIALEITREPITSGIRKKLPWIEPYFQKNLRLNGTTLGRPTGLANILGWDDFDMSGDLARTR
jgi:hypothetical protein